MIKINSNYAAALVENTGSRNGRKATKENYRWIVVHYVGACNWSTGFESTAKGNAQYYQRAKIGASANFFVDSTDEVYVGVPWDGDRYAWHCGAGSSGQYSYCIYDADGTFCCNPNSIGVEICTCKMNPATKSGNDWYFDPRTYENAVNFIQYLMKEFNIDINHVVRHYDVNTIHKKCPGQFVGNDIKKYYNKTGEQLWQEFKQRLAGVPAPTPKSIEAAVKPGKTFKVGDVLTCFDLDITVNMSDGTKILNPSGWSASPLKLSYAQNKITIKYQNLNTALIVNAEINNPFIDINKSMPFYDNVMFVYDRHILNGLTNNLFGVDKELTRSMASTVIYNLEGKPAIKVDKPVFADVQLGKWYTIPVAWTTFIGITKGEGNNIFNPKMGVKLQDFVVMLYRYAQYKKYKTNVKSKESYKKLNNYTQISDYAKEAMNWAAEYNILNKVPVTPKTSMVRQNVAILISNFVKQYM